MASNQEDSLLNSNNNTEDNKDKNTVKAKNKNHKKAQGHRDPVHSLIEL